VTLTSALLNPKLIDFQNSLSNTGMSSLVFLAALVFKRKNRQTVLKTLPQRLRLVGWLVGRLTSPFSTQIGYIGDKVLHEI